MSETRQGRILVVEDDPQVRDLFSNYLEERYDVRTAPSGEEALAIVSDDVDVVLLDRRMPGLSGDEVLAEIRAQGIECRVAMITASRPDLDIVELGFDDYVVKPVAKSELHNVVDSLLHWERYDAIVQEYFTLTNRVEVLEDEFGQATLADSEEYRRLLSELEELRAESRETIEAIDTTTVDGLGAPLDRAGSDAGSSGP